jgi:glycerophosphoryl diester phosphodiesterase
VRTIETVAFLVFVSACGPAPKPAATDARPSRPARARAARIEVQGHRGARAVFPEESLPAFAHALDVGVDTLELDLAVTKDDRLVVLHDLTINDALCVGRDGSKLTERPAVRTLTLAQVKEYDCGSLPNARFPKQASVPGTRIATLAEVFDLVEHASVPAARTVGFNIEMKSLPAHPELVPSPDDFARKIKDEVAAHHMLGRVTIQSFDHRMLAAMKAIAPAIPISALIEGTLPDLVGLAERLGAEIVSPEVDWITAADVRALHSKGIRVIPWTANTPEQWSYLVGIDVDGIISDDPAALVAYLRARGLR